MQYPESKSHSTRNTDEKGKSCVKAFGIQKTRSKVIFFAKEIKFKSVNRIGKTSNVFGKDSAGFFLRTALFTADFS
jgi:hypothetical protein